MRLSAPMMRPIMQWGNDRCSLFHDQCDGLDLREDLRLHTEWVLLDDVNRRYNLGRAPSE